MKAVGKKKLGGGRGGGGGRLSDNAVATTWPSGDFYTLDAPSITVNPTFFGLNTHGGGGKYCLQISVGDQVLRINHKPALA